MVANLSHIPAGFKLGLHHRHELKRLVDSTAPDTGILKLDPETLRASGIAALALDFDGVLAPHGDLAPLPEAIVWMKQCEAVFGSDKMFILSNKPTDERKQWFARNLPGMRFIAGVRKKPYPDGLNKTGELAGVPLSSLLMVDDRLLTGCLAAIAAGARPCYIRKPYISFKQRPLAELFFGFLRLIEQLFVRVISAI